MMQSFALQALPFILVFVCALVATLILTPIVREINRALGMIDKPDPRRINRVPIPRGGGLALVIGSIVPFSLFLLFAKNFDAFSSFVGVSVHFRLVTIALILVAIGYVDDKWSLPARVKLLGQIIVAFLCWWWGGLGFSRIFPCLPAGVDCVLTMLWFVGAINAFNLIDGLDGLASGIAFIATLGMAGSLILIGHENAALYHFAFAGALLGFLRYNYNPASVFLGDCGSMFIGYTLAAMPLVSQTPNSFVVSVGVPFLAMGVPIFDSALAIIRRLIRRLIHHNTAQDAGNAHVMTADADHVHHRILRAVGLSQRKTAWILYVITLMLVAIGFFATYLRSRTSSVWLIAIMLGSVVIFRNMARIELYDASRLLSTLAHSHLRSSRRRWAQVSVPLFVFCDVIILAISFFIVVKMEGHYSFLRDLFPRLLVRVVAVYAMLIFFNVYRTVWSRAMLSNFVRLLLACVFGSLIGGIVIGFVYPFKFMPVATMTISYALLTAAGLITLRTIRPFIRDLFYALDCMRLRERKDVSRILVYGAGLRYRSFRRELVRTTSANKRIIVGLLDDDILLREHFIGGVRVLGTLQDAPEVITRLNVDAVVIACVVSPEWLRVMRQMLEPTGVKITVFSFSETPLNEHA